MIKYISSMLYLFTFVRKRGVMCAVDFTYTRRLLDSFESAVPAIVLSYAPTFFLGVRAIETGHHKVYSFHS